MDTIMGTTQSVSQYQSDANVDDLLATNPDNHSNNRV